MITLSQFTNIILEPEQVIRQEMTEGLRLFFNDKRKTTCLSTNDYYHVNNNYKNIYFAYPSDDFGWIVLDSNRSMLMMDIETEKLQIPYLDLKVQKNNNKIVAMFYVWDADLFLSFEQINIRNISQTSLKYLIEMNTERARNAKILK